MPCLPIELGKTPTRRAKVAGSQTIVKGDMLVNSSGFLATASAGGNVPVVAIAAEAASSTTEGDKILVYEVTPDIKFVCDTDDVPTQAQMNAAVDIASKSTLDEDASADDIFFAEEIVGAAADQKVRGYFTYGAPNS